MKLMRKHPDLHDLNLGPVNRVVGHAKHCTGCLVANRRLGARVAYNHCLTKVATSPGECCFADVAGVVTYAHYACVANCADAMADAWEDTAGCAQAICLHENLLK